MLWSPSERYQSSEQELVLGLLGHVRGDLDGLPGIQVESLILAEVDLRVAEQRHAQRVGPGDAGQVDVAHGAVGALRQPEVELSAVVDLGVRDVRVAELLELDEPAAGLPWLSFIEMCSVLRASSL